MHKRKVELFLLTTFIIITLCGILILIFISPQLNIWFKAETLVDVTLAAGGRHLQAHKVVLSACSEYFQSVFASNPCQVSIFLLLLLFYTLSPGHFLSFSTQWSFWKTLTLKTLRRWWSLSIMVLSMSAPTNSRLFLTRLMLSRSRAWRKPMN